MSLRAHPARRVYYDWDDVSTNPDYKLGVSFDHTSPGVELRRTAREDEPTLTDWVLPMLSGLVIGFFVNRWWSGRKAANDSTTVVGEDAASSSSGFDLLGAVQ